MLMSRVNTETQHPFSHRDMDSYDSLENYPRRLMKKATLAFSLLQPRDVPLFFTRDKSQIEWRLERRCFSCRFSHVCCDQFFVWFLPRSCGFPFSVFLPVSRWEVFRVCCPCCRFECLMLSGRMCWSPKRAKNCMIHVGFGVELQGVGP